MSTELLYNSINLGACGGGGGGQASGLESGRMRLLVSVEAL